MSDNSINRLIGLETAYEDGSGWPIAGQGRVEYRLNERNSMKCIQCGNEFEAKRKTALYCSGKCRKLAFRKTPVSVPEVSVPPIAENAKPANYGQADCQCKHCQASRSHDHRWVINHGPWKSLHELAANEVNRVSLPGDVDYHGVEGIQRVVASTHLAIAGCV